MLSRGQDCEFCHIESSGKNNVTGLIKLQLTSFFLRMELIYIVFIYQPVSFQKSFKVFQNGALVTIAL